MTTKECEYKAGDKVRGELQGVRVTSPGAVNTWEGVVISSELDTDFDPPEELVHVRFTRACTWDRLHGVKTGFFRPDEISPMEAK